MTSSSASLLDKSPFALWRLLVAAAAILIAAVYFQPVWWVALKAPNYPEHTFPDGIRIHFHVDGVNNGCTVRKSQEVEEKESLDCVHEMDTINHFVGMFPIASGGPVEKLYAPFLFSFLILTTLGFALPHRRLRLAFLTLGYGATVVWMTMALLRPDGVAYLGQGYIAAAVNSLGQAEETESDENLSPVVRQLKESLKKSGLLEEKPTAPKLSGSKPELIGVLKSAFEKDQANRPSSERQEWTGSGLQVFAWHYDRSLNRWFNEPEKNGRLVAIMTTVAKGLFGALVVAFAAFVWLARDAGKIWYWALGLVPLILPVAFLAEYSGWLWWYGHSLNAMGAFTLKPFMPTVLGQGKVAQFTTLSYPHTGFFLMLGVGALMAVAMVLRRNDGPTA